MPKYVIQIETRKEGAIGAFAEDTVTLTADNTLQARDMALGLARRNGLEPRSIIKVKEVQS